MSNHFREELVAYEYTTFPRRFLAYKWFKPLLVAAATAVLVLLFQLVLGVACAIWVGGMDLMMESMNRSNELFFRGPGAIMAIGGVATLLPALFLASCIVRDRPFSSYSSSRGGWNWGAFAKSLGVAAIVFGVIIVAQALLLPEPGVDGVNRFNIIGFLAILILVPIQATAEEYVYRGLAMQAIGSWTNLPVLALVLSSLLFAVSHSYGVLGILSVFCHGLGLAFITQHTKGLEASSAAHIANNTAVFILNGLGLATSSEGGIDSFVITVVMMAIYCVAIVLLDKRFSWFTSQGDGTIEFNEKYRAKAKKQ